MCFKMATLSVGNEDSDDHRPVRTQAGRGGGLGRDPVDLSIREERPEDDISIRHVNEVAFERPQEARLGDALRVQDAIVLALVAVVDGRVVGHILFSPVRLQSGAEKFEGAGLGPMAGLPRLQRRGIGSKLVFEGTRRLRVRASLGDMTCISAATPRTALVR